jgi:HlyD family secretion protein
VRLQGVVERIQVRGTTQDGEVTYTVIVAPDRHEPRLRWNMSATVRIATDP